MAQSRRRHFGRTENGNIEINPRIFTIIGVILALLSFFGGIVYQAMAMSERIATDEQTYNACCYDNTVTHPSVAQNSRDIAVIQSQHVDFNKRLDSIDKKLDSIQSTLQNGGR